MFEWRAMARRVLAATGRQLDRVSRALTYAAAGTTRLADMRTGIIREWHEYNAREPGSPGLARWEEDIVARFVRPAHRVLVVGCGAGRDLLPFVAMGCRVVGVEPVAAAAAALERVLLERGWTATIQQGFIEDMALEGTFDFVLFSPCCYSYIPEARRRIETLRKTTRHLAPGGRILIGVVEEPVGADPRFVAVGRMTGALSRSDWRIEDGDVFWPNRLSDALFYYHHVFRPGELEQEAEQAGLRLAYRVPAETVSVFVARDAT